MTKFELPKLDFDYGALEPYIDAKTMEIHHTKHHQAYIDKLNAGMDGEKWFEDKSLEEIIVNWEDAPEGKKDIVRNHGGGHHNHSFFWAILTPGGNDQVSGDLLDKINTDFGSVDECKLKVTEAATTHFGSGWGWLVLNKDSKLEALSTPNQNSPLMYGCKPLLGVDVWEHAYYLKYQNKRPDYLDAFWQILNWKVVSDNYSKAID